LWLSAGGKIVGHGKREKGNKQNVRWLHVEALGNISLKSRACTAVLYT
jgi:hypothetical protein